jgi:hypothetical protein
MTILPFPEGGGIGPPCGRNLTNGKKGQENLVKIIDFYKFLRL